MQLHVQKDTDELPAWQHGVPKAQAVHIRQLFCERFLDSLPISMFRALTIGGHGAEKPRTGSPLRNCH